jgi:hypothetical protein
MAGSAWSAAARTNSISITSSPSRRAGRRPAQTISNCCAPATTSPRERKRSKGLRLACDHLVPSIVRLLCDLSRGVSQVARGHDMIANKGRSGPMPGDWHRHTLRDGRIDHVAHGGPPQIMLPLLRHARPLARTPPRPIDIFPWLPPRLGPRKAGKTWGITLPSSRPKVRTLANWAASPAFNSGVRYTRRPSPFFEPPGGSRSVSTSRSTWLHVKGRTSSVKRHP